MSIKTLKYQHKCGKTWDTALRAAEEERKAFAQRKQTHSGYARVTAEAEPKPKYASLLAQIY